MEASLGRQQRNEFFHKLKPCCVKISQLAIRESHEATAAHELRELVQRLADILNAQIQENALVLDEKLAEYVFFPLSHIFRQMDRYPMPLIEDSLKCLTILIVHGWKSKISPTLVQQILSLITFIIDGTPGATVNTKLDEETALEAFRGLTALFTTAGLNASVASGLADSDTIPALGHSVTVMLDGVAEGATPHIQQEALRALQALYLAIKEQAALASFLPGTISSLAKVIASPNHYKKNVLTKCLDTVSLVLTQVLADLRNRTFLVKAKEEELEKGDKGKQLSSAWLKATSTQVKLALSPMMKLRTYDAIEVRQSLNNLCVTLLDECHKTLEDSATILVETAIILWDKRQASSLTETGLQDLVSIYPELGEIAKTATYNWLLSLPRTMQSGDENVKRNSIRNLSNGLELLRSLHIESSTIEDALSGTLRDSIVSLTQSSEPRRLTEGSKLHSITEAQNTIDLSDGRFHPVLLPYESQRMVRDGLMSLIKLLGASSQHTRLATTFLEQAQESSSTHQVVAFWLCFQLVKKSHESLADVDAFLDLSSLTAQSDDLEMVFSELYSSSVRILDRQADMGSLDWRLEAVALEVVAYAAHRSGVDFKPELIDVLFPITTLLGSKSPELQSHAVVTLNSVAKSCDYEDVSELIIDNVDYMVNSVSLRLNTLDISPASINVLRMMIQLAGPRLVPYLDDVVESIFASLDNYHGYPLFVEGLFTVLKEIVQQGVKSDMLLLENQKASAVDHRKKAPKANGIAHLLDILAKRREQSVREENEKTSGHPGEPWGNESAQEEGKHEDSTEPPHEEEKPPNTQTYQLLLRVSNLTQHYLTSPTPSLRRSLLELLATAAAALAPDEEAFLPLVNATWPVIVDRLRDDETFIAIEACRTLAGLCGAAGDFLASRFKTEWHDWLRDWCRRTKQRASSKPYRAAPHGEVGVGGKAMQIRTRVGGDTLAVDSFTSTSPVPIPSSGSLGQFASPARLWESTVKLLTAITSHVRMDEDMFDDVLELLADVLQRDDEARQALEAINGDAVWLVQYERGLIDRLPEPRMGQVEFARL